MKSLQLSSLLLMLFFEYCNAQSLPDYWSGKISTSKNATMLNQVPFKIFGSNKEYNKEDSPRDFELQLGIGNRTSGIAQSKRNPTNEPPVNETGTVCIRMFDCSYHLFLVWYKFARIAKTFSDSTKYFFI